MGNFRQEFLSIKKSGLFDSQYYLQSYPDVKKSGMDAIKHYILYGWKEGRNPSADFETTHYLVTYPDIKQAGINPLLHYIKHGKNEGRSVNSKHEKILIAKKITPVENIIILFKHISSNKFLIRKFITNVTRKGLKFTINKTQGKVKNILTEKYYNDKFRKPKRFFEIKMSVIIPTYNRSKILPLLLESWKVVDKVTKYKYELIFSDDGSDDGSMQFCKRKKTCRSK